MPRWQSRHHLLHLRWTSIDEFFWKVAQREVFANTLYCHVRRDSSAHPLNSSTVPSGALWPQSADSTTFSRDAKDRIVFPFHWFCSLLWCEPAWIHQIRWGCVWIATLPWVYHPFRLNSLVRSSFVWFLSILRSLGCWINMQKDTALALADMSNIKSLASIWLGKEHPL